MSKQKQDCINEAWLEYCASLKDVNLIETGVPPMFVAAFNLGVNKGVEAVERYKRAKESGSNRFINAAIQEIEALE